MPTQVIAPRLGVTVTEVRIVEWLVAQGEYVAEGAPLLAVATDKAEHEIPAPASGTVHHIAAIDEECVIGAVLGEIA